jgi:plasmid stability protein
MPNLTIKDLPAQLHRQLKARAAQNRRSLNSEIIMCLQGALANPDNDREEAVQRIRRLREQLPIRFDEAEFNRYKRSGRT